MDKQILYDIEITKVNAVYTLYSEQNKARTRLNRPCWAILLKYEGETIYTNKDKTYISNLENVVILPKGSSYEWKCTKPGRCYSIEFECNDFCDSIFSFPIDNREKILQLYKDIEYKLTLKRKSYKLEIFKNLYSLLLLILQSKQQKYTPSKKQEKIAPAVEYILNNYNLPMKNDDLAKLTGLSTIYFRKLFTEIFGLSPIAYVHKLRIKKAKEMLKSDYGSIEEIALTLGYANLYDFSRTFKKHIGIPPTTFACKHKTPSCN